MAVPVAVPSKSNDVEPVADVGVVIDPVALALKLATRYPLAEATVVPVALAENEPESEPVAGLTTEPVALAENA